MENPQKKDKVGESWLSGQIGKGQGQGREGIRVGGEGIPAGRSSPDKHVEQQGKGEI